MNILNVIIIFSFMLFVIYMNKKNLFLTLLWFEIFILSFILLFSFMKSLLILKLGSVLVIIIAFSICEASSALSLLINLSRHSSNLSMKAINLNNW